MNPEEEDWSQDQIRSEGHLRVSGQMLEVKTEVRDLASAGLQLQVLIQTSFTKKSSLVANQLLKLPLHSNRIGTLCVCVWDQWRS